MVSYRLEVKKLKAYIGRMKTANENKQADIRMLLQQLISIRNKVDKVIQTYTRK